MSRIEVAVVATGDAVVANKINKDLKDGNLVDAESLLDSIDRLTNSPSDTVRKFEECSKSNKPNLLIPLNHVRDAMNEPKKNRWKHKVIKTHKKSLV